MLFIHTGLTVKYNVPTKFIKALLAFMTRTASAQLSGNQINKINIRKVSLMCEINFKKSAKKQHIYTVV